MTNPNQERRLSVNYQKIFKKLPGLYLILEPHNYQILAASDSYLQAIKMERSDIIGKKLFKDLPEHPKEEQLPGLQKLRTSLDRVKTNRCTDVMPIISFPLTLPETDGQKLENRWWNPVNIPVFNDKEDIDFIIHRIEDVTSVIHRFQKGTNIEEPAEKLTTEDSLLAADIILRGEDLQKAKEHAFEQLQASERKYETLFNKIDEGFCIIEKIETPEGEVSDYRFVEANPGFQAQTKLNTPEGKTILDLVPEIEEEILRICDRVVATGKSLRFEEFVSSWDLWVSAFVFRFGPPEYRRLGVIFNDITEQKKVEEALRESKEKYQTLFESIDSGFCIIKVFFDENNEAVDYRFLETNPSFEKQSGVKDAEGKLMSEISPDLEDYWFKIYGNVAKKREPIRFERSAKIFNRIYDVFAFPNGPPEDHKVAVLFNDITERKQTEEELRASKERLSTALEIDTVGVLFWDNNYRITEVNEAFLEMSNFSYEEAIGKKWQELTPEEFHSASEKAISDLQTTGRTEPYEKQYYRKDGSRWWGLFAPRKINEKEVVEYVIDITERKQREQRDQFLLRLNDALRSIYDSIEIQNKAIHLLKEELNADRVLYIESNSVEDQYIIKNNATGNVPSIVGKINLSDFGSPLMDKLRAGDTYVQKDAPNDPDLSEEEKENYRQIDVKSKVAVPLVKKDELIFVLTVEKAEPYDYSEHEIALVEETAERTWAYVERLRAEEKLLALKNHLEERVKERTAALKDYQEQLRSLASRLNKTEEKEQRRLAAELHDNLGQLLTLGKMKIQNLIKNDFPSDIANQITDLSKLMDDALTYTRELMSDLTPPPSLDKENVIEFLDWIAKKMKKRGLKVAIEVDDQPKPLDEEVRTVLHRSVDELLFNVVKHAKVDKARVNVSRQNNMIQIVVEDNGKGFSMEGEKPVPTEEGGFGLFNIRERMNYLGGDLEINSEPGKGTKVMLYAPLKREDNSDKSEKKTIPKSPLPNQSSIQTELRKKVRVLLADDHAMVRRGLREMIEEQDDMTIIAEASDGKEAVELARKYSPDIIVMDVNMPVMDGIEATREITSIIPNIRVVGLSLHDHQKVADEMRSAGATAYLTKTEAFETLCTTIRSEARMT